MLSPYTNITTNKMVPEDTRTEIITRKENPAETEDFRDGRRRYILTNPRIVNYQVGTQTQTSH